MRHNKSIAYLSASYQGILAPRDGANTWKAWSREAREIVADNLSDCGGNFISNEIRKSWEYDTFKQEFYFLVEYALESKVGDQQLYGRFNTGFTLNPTKPLGEEIERLKKELNAWIHAVRSFIRYGAGK